jgi:hypothetical protein
MRRVLRVEAGDGRRRFEAMLAKMTFMDRLKPVLALAADHIKPDPKDRAQGAHLPEYCHKLASIIRKSHLRVIRGPADVISYDPSKLAACKSIDEARPLVRIDWRAYGAWIGTVELVPQFLDGPLGRRVEAELAHVPPAALDLVFGGDLKEPTEPEIQAAQDGVKRLREHAVAFASGWGTTALAELFQGIADGLTGMFNEKLEAANSTPREGIYDFLAIAWPEIQQMQASTPPKSRRDLFEWLQPFVKDGIVSLGDYDQLCDVCDEIGLRMKGRGRPRKSR